MENLSSFACIETYNMCLVYVNADSSEDYAVAVMRKLRDGTEKMMGHLGDEHAMDITALMSMFNKNSVLLYSHTQ